MQETHPNTEVVGTEARQEHGKTKAGGAGGSQPDLFVMEAREPPLRLAARMLRILEHDRRWVNRREMREAHGFTDRECRLARRYSRGRIIMGQAGYRATRWATLPEVQHAADVFMSQARDMMASTSEYWRVITRRQKETATHEQ
jgi:hypothetical protein